MEELVEAPMEPLAVIALGLQLADALDAAHRVGLVHGDVRPGNLLLGSAGVKLFDFGVAGWTGVGEGSAAGRPGHTAPEVQAGAPPGVAADLYGLGVVLYRGLAGRDPFVGPTPWARIGAQRAGPPAPPPGPAGLVQLVQVLLHPDPARRPPDAAAVRSVLTKLQKNPRRRRRTTRRWLAPVRPGRAWIVHGTDPTTGGPSLVRAGLSRARAKALAARLGAEGWSVEAERVAIGAAGLAGVIVAGVVGMLVVPVVGVVLGIWAGLWVTSRGCRPRLLEVLPMAAAPVPPRAASPGAEYAISAGLLLLLSALLLTVWPWLALVPLGLAGGVVAWAIRSRPEDPARRAARARLDNAVEEVRRVVERHEHPLDVQLAILGELDEVEREWRGGRLGDDAALLAIEELHRRAASGRLLTGDDSWSTLDALRRSRSRDAVTPDEPGTGGSGEVLGRV